MLVRLLGSILCICIIALGIVAVATAHLAYAPKGESLQALERSQERNLAHADYVCEHGSKLHRRWACKARRWLGRELKQTRAARLVSLSPRAAICQVFGAYCSQALAVSYCETGGTYSVYATNGQYLGLFQMGDYARSRYGHSHTALGQSRSAYAYFIDAGSDWSPWACKPY